MITLLVYIIIDLVLIFFAYKLFRSIKKEYNLFSAYFLYAILIYSLGQTLSVLSIIIYYFSQQAMLLYLVDVIGRLSLYSGSAILAQVPLYLYFPESKKRYLASYLIFAIGLVSFFYNLTLKYYPFIDSAGIIRWETPLSLGAIMGITLICVWLPTSIVFLIQFVKSSYRSMRSLLLGLGFLFATFGGIAQDFGRDSIEYLLINSFFIIGFALVFSGVLINEKSNKSAG